MELKSHQVHVILGRTAVETFNQQEASLLELSRLGVVRTFRFATLQEVNAFTDGIEVATGFDDALPVDGLNL